MFSTDPDFNWIKVLAFAAFASFGGVMGHLMRTLDQGAKINWAKAGMEGLAAGFVGLLVLMACSAMQIDESWTGVIVGVSGWMGANASIRVLETLVFKRLGISQENRNEPSSNP